MATKKTETPDIQNEEAKAAGAEAAEPTELEKARAEIEALKSQLAEARTGAETEKPAEPDDPWKRMVRVQSPRTPPNSGIDYHFISVNDHRWQIPADGKFYELPEPIAKVLIGYSEAEARADEYMRKVERDSHDPVLKPKQF